MQASFAGDHPGSPCKGGRVFAVTPQIPCCFPLGVTGVGVGGWQVPWEMASVLLPGFQSSGRRENHH